jgi:ABC-type Fe3+-hydroxamate transport system substrate-binding protein
VLAWRPDALLVSVVPGEEDSTRARLQQDRGLRLLPCVQQQHIVFVPAALLASTSHLVVGVSEQLQAQLRTWGHP